jgi:hypothetical protein
MVVNFKIWRECRKCVAQRISIELSTPQEVVIEAISSGGFCGAMTDDGNIYLATGSILTDSYEWRSRFPLSKIYVDATGDEPITWIIRSSDGKVLLLVENSTTRE